MQTPMKPARIYCGAAVDGAGIYAKVMIPADQKVCPSCLGLGIDLGETDEPCEACEGLGTVPETPINIED